MNDLTDTIRRHAMRKRADARDSYRSGIVMLVLGFLSLAGLILLIAQGGDTFGAITLAVLVFLQSVLAFIHFNASKLYARMAVEWEAKADEVERERP